MSKTECMHAKRVLKMWADRVTEERMPRRWRQAARHRCAMRIHIQDEYTSKSVDKIEQCVMITALRFVCKRGQEM